MYCDTNQLPTLPFFGSHTKPHGARGLGKHYNLRFDTIDNSSDEIHATAILLVRINITHM